MGGFGSGKRSNRWRVEDCTVRLSLPDLLRQGSLLEYDVCTTISFWNGDNLLYSLEITVSRIAPDQMSWYVHNTGQSIKLHSTPLHFGGCRWWFECPGCRRRCSKLYLAPQGTSFACRICHHLWYRSTSNQDEWFYGFLARGGGVSTEDIRMSFAVSEASHHQRFVRKRDRRKSYKPREGWEVYNLKRTKKGRAIIRGVLAHYAKTKRAPRLRGFARTVESEEPE